MDILDELPCLEKRTILNTVYFAYKLFFLNDLLTTQNIQEIIKYNN